MRFPAHTRMLRMLAATAVALWISPASAALTAAPCDSVSFGVLLDVPGGWGGLSGNAGCRNNGDLLGHVEYVQHTYAKHDQPPFHMRSTAITAYLFDPAAPTARDICGYGVLDDGSTARFRVRVQDMGKNDFAGIVIDSSSGRITVATHFAPPGNVQLHDGNGARSGPGFFPIDETQACGGLPPP